MKTTVDIADPLFRQAKVEAEKNGSTLRNLIEDGLRAVLEKRRTVSAKPFRLGELPAHGGGLKPDFQYANWEGMLEESYRDRGA